VSRYQKGKTNLDFTEARDSEWQWHQLDHMQVCTSLQTDNHASTTPLSFLQARCPSCHPTNSIKAVKVKSLLITNKKNNQRSNTNAEVQVLHCSKIHWFMALMNTEKLKHRLQNVPLNIHVVAVAVLTDTLHFSIHQ